MSALYILLAGFLLGLRHALDADHLAAVASLVTRSRSMGETVRTGIAWGIGHTVTLFLVSGVVIVEVIFTYPGLGRLMVDSVSFRDVPMIQAVTMIFCSFYIALNISADILAIFANPRLRYSK